MVACGSNGSIRTEVHTGCKRSVAAATERFVTGLHGE
jgi:hypothetical protein